MMSVRTVLQQLRNNGISGGDLQKVLQDKEKKLKMTPVTQVGFVEMDKV